MKVNQHSGKTFLLNVVSFAFIFIAISFIVFQIISASIYNSVDQELMSAVELSKGNTQQIEDVIRQEVFNNFIFSDPNNEKSFINKYQIQYLCWSEDGTLLNKSNFKQFCPYQDKVTLNDKNLGTIQELTFKSDSGQSFRYHSVTIDTTNLLSGTPFANSVQYVQLLINTDQIYQAQSSFKKVLISCMVFFWLVSIGVSFFISKVAMQPVLQAWKKQQEFVENASHELRTPLAIIQSKLESMLTRPTNTVIDESENIALSLAETRRLNQLTKDLLQLARADNANMPLKKDSVNILRLINQVVEPYKEISISQNKKLLTNVLTDSVAIVDETKIHQLLVILIDNALKYTPAGGTIELISTVKNGNWLLDVKDTGVGVKDEDKKKIFQRFFREDGSRQRETGGYGLGLAIAKEIVEQHKGKIRVIDNQPEGSIFQVSIPIGKEDKKANVQ